MSHVSIRMATRNGATYLADQMASFVSQTHRDWSLIVSDDGSTDGTLTEVQNFAEALPKGRVQIRHGPLKGFAANFLSLLAMGAHGADFVALSDQDDVWFDQKLTRAVAALSRTNPDTPALYCGRTLVADAQLRPQHPSPLFRRGPNFANALVQSIAGGNTMVLNRAGAELMALATAQKIVSHDWWIYLIISGVGGQIIYDRDPCLLYRQHGQNQSGSNIGLGPGLRRLSGLSEGRFRDWATLNTEALIPFHACLTPANQTVLNRFLRARSGNHLLRPLRLCRSGVYRQGTLGTTALLAASAFGKV